MTTDTRHDPAKRLATFQRFIEAVEDGQSIKEACKTAEVAWGSIQRWIVDPANVTPATDTEQAETFAARYARARLTSAAGFAERALDTALEAEDAAIARLQVDTLKWRAAMADPKNYGDRKQVEISGGIEHLHLDALRSPRVTAKATLANELPVSMLPHVSGDDSADVDGQPIDTEQAP